MNKKFNRFTQAFYPLFGRSHDWDVYELIASRLSEKSVPSIVHLFCKGEEEPMLRIWSWMCLHWGAEAYIAEPRVEVLRRAKATCYGMHIELMDTVEYLRNEAPLYTCDILFIGGDKNSHLEEELESSVEDLPDKALVVVDNCQESRREIAKHFLTEHQYNLVFDGLVSVWEKNSDG